MCKRIKENERFCLICNKELKDENDISNLIGDNIICRSCKEQFVKMDTIYRLDKDWIVLYEYNEFLERLLFRYKEQRDVELARVFFFYHIEKIKKLSNHYTICVMCSSDKNRYIRGFEPIIQMLEVHGIKVYSPLYKIKHIKQSSKNKQERKEIQKYIKRKDYYELPNKPILLIDDVLTTSNTLRRGIELLEPEKVLVLCANPLWIDAMRVEKQKRF